MEGRIPVKTLRREKKERSGGTHRHICILAILLRIVDHDHSGPGQTFYFLLRHR